MGMIKIHTKNTKEVLPFDLNQAFDVFLLTNQSFMAMDAYDVIARLTFALPCVGKTN